MPSLILALLLLFLTGCGVTKSSLYPGTAQTPTLQEAGVTILGEVTACQGAFCEGQWPLSLPQPPPAYTYQRAIQKKAATQFSAPESEIVLGEIAVGYHAEMIGTIRGWEATAMVGRKSGSGAAQAAPDLPSWLPR